MPLLSPTHTSTPSLPPYPHPNAKPWAAGCCSLITQAKIQMSYHAIDDSGEFNDSEVYLHPLRLEAPPARPAVPSAISSLGVYDSIKLAGLPRGRQGALVQLVRLDARSGQAWVTEEGEATLREYATSEVAFAVVAGNRGSGKSFFCDKILNLAEVRGNHFCRSKAAGINMWSAPFEKHDLKIFLLEIAGCDLASPHFALLLTYALMFTSAFLLVDDRSPPQHNSPSALEQFDGLLGQLIDQITPSRLKGEEEPASRSALLPEFFYFLRRTPQRKDNQALTVLTSFIESRLPDARATGFVGEEQELLHIPFLDTKCISQEYMREVAAIFSQLYDVITEKRYKELSLTGSIVVKVLRYIEGYLNGKPEASEEKSIKESREGVRESREGVRESREGVRESREGKESREGVNMEKLYGRVINDLYQSAYNYCILSYHEEMEREFEDEEPKSLEQLIAIFDTASSNVLDRFQEFTLDEHFHRLYRTKLEHHIDEKELMILDINKLKTQRVIADAHDPSALTDYPAYRAFLDSLSSKHPHLNHGAAEPLSRVGADFMGRTKGVDFKALKEIERLNGAIEQQSHVLTDLKHKNDQKSKERSAVNRQQEELFQAERRLDARRKELTAQLAHAKNASFEEPEEIARERERLEEAIKRNNALIHELRKADGRKTKDVAGVESRIEETTRNITRLEKMLTELRSGGPAEPKEGKEGKEGKKESKSPKKEKGK